MTQNKNLQNLNQSNDLIKIGKIVNTHSINGDLKVFIYPNNFDFSLSEVLIMHNGELTEEKVTKFKSYKNNYLIHLERYKNINDVLKFKNDEIYAELNLNGEREFFYYELINYDVKYKEKSLGKITNYFLQGNFYSVDLNRNDLSIPLIGNFVKGIDRKNKILNIDIPEGYLDYEEN